MEGAEPVNLPKQGASHEGFLCEDQVRVKILSNGENQTSSKDVALVFLSVMYLLVSFFTCKFASLYIQCIDKLFSLKKNYRGI